LATLSITKQWANGEVLLEADLDYIKSDVETFLNTTKINDDNIQASVITGSTKLIDLSVTAAKLATDSVETAKIGALQVTNAKIAASTIEIGKLAASAISALVPYGTVWAYGGTSAPTGWLLCDGSSLLRAGTYADLFTAISTTYGTADSDHFNIPDLRGRVIAGQDDMGGSSQNRLTGLTGGVDGDTLGATGGAETHALTGSQTQAHTHTYSGNTGAPDGSSYNTDNIGVNATSNSAHLHAYSGTTSGYSATADGAAHNNVQPTIILNYIIRATTIS
jgi:microcystin-dependent protein